MTKEEVVFHARQIKIYCKERVRRHKECACDRCPFGDEDGCCRLNAWPDHWKIKNKDLGEKVNFDAVKG